MTAAFNPSMISVIMPCYNAAPFVEEAVQSTLRQSYEAVELIIVDDGSTDGSLEILGQVVKEYPGRIKLLFQNHMGPFPARNLGMAEASGGLIAFLDADDYWSPDCLEKLQCALEAHQADIAYCGWQNVGDGARDSVPYIPPDYSLMDTTAEFLRACPWPIHAALVRRPLMDAVRGFSERRFSAMDYDLWLRLYAHTQKIVRVPEVMAFYRWHGGGQISGTLWKQVLDAVAVREDFAAHYPERLNHMDERRRFDLTSGVLLKEAYRAYWKRQLVDARILFRRALFKGHWKIGDLKYLLPALLPASLFQTLIRTNDRLRERKA